MTRIAAVMTALLILAGCGADGEPTRPSLNAGVGIDSSGNLKTRASVGTRIGPLGVSLGL